MTQADFTEVATAKELDEKTIEVLKTKKYDTEESLGQMSEQQLKELDISEAQKEALQKWLSELQSKSPAAESEEKTVEITVTEETAEETPAKTEQDYEAPSTPCPSMYEKCINIAVTGATSAGKSSLINALRGIEPSDSDAASTEPKTVAVPYNLTKVEKMVLWELPDTDKDGGDDFLKKVEFDQYDGVIICAGDKLTDADLWLASVAEKVKLKPFVVRTKYDSAVDADREAHGEEHNEEKVQSKIRDELNEQLKDSNIYLVSTQKDDLEKYDFAKLQKDIEEVKKSENKIKLFESEKAEGKADDADRISEKGDAKKDEKKVVSEPEKIENLAEKFMKEVDDVVKKAAKKGSTKILHKEIARYKKEFKVEKDELPSINLQSLDDAVNDQLPEPSAKGIKAKFMSCIGGRSAGALTADLKQKLMDTISDGAPDLLKSAITACKDAALAKLAK